MFYDFSIIFTTQFYTATADEDGADSLPLQWENVEVLCTTVGVCLHWCYVHRKLEI